VGAARSRQTLTPRADIVDVPVTTRGAGTSLAGQAEKWSKQLRDGIMEHGVVNHKKYGDVFAYEVDGYGSTLLMDDANYPSLLALPVMGFADVNDKIYQNTRKMILEQEGNPYYLKGKAFKGIGGLCTPFKTRIDQSSLY
jgi:meiotically up-regulated gene 157 (Mug157) protein